MAPGKSLVPCMLLLEQESYLPYIKKVIKTILQTTVPYTTILKNQQHKALDTIIVENQSAAIKKVEELVLFLLFVT